jgi:hypothetical protein
MQNRRHKMSKMEDKSGDIELKINDMISITDMIVKGVFTAKIKEAALEANIGLRKLDFEIRAMKMGFIDGSHFRESINAT